EQLVTLQEDLLKAGFKVEGENEKDISNSLALQIEAFMSYYEVSANDEEFEQFLDNVVNHSLQKGQEEDEVALLKEHLHTLGFLNEIDDSLLFNEETEEALINLQQECDLVVNGIVDPKTEEMIEELLKDLETSLDEKDPTKSENVSEEIEDEVVVPEEGVADSEDEVIESEDEDITESEEIATETEEAFVAEENNDDVENEEVIEESSFMHAPMTASLRNVASITAYKKGDRAEYVVQLKKELGILGFPVPGKGTTLFGAETEKQVKAFQSYFSLEVDGFAGPATQAKLSEQANTPLQKGKRHADTKKLKSDLKAIGYPVPGKGTTLYGKDTETVVKNFQKLQGLVVNGIGDQVTLAKIKSLQSAGNNTQDENKVAYVKGDRHSYVVQLKKDLAKLGFK